MKTERFAAIVEAAGKPVTHLLLISPEKDKTLQAAIKTRRVMTVHQNLSGNKADYGDVGFEPGAGRQYLIFPKSLSKYQGSRIVAIKYELFEDGMSTKRVEPPKPAKKEQLPKPTKEKVQRPEAPPEKVVHFAKPEPPPEPDEESEALQEIKNQVRHAMEALEQGKQIAAFNLLKRIVDR